MRLGILWVGPLIATGLGGAVSARMTAQTVQLAEGPRFLTSVSPDSATPVDASTIPALQRRVSAEFVHVPLADALQRIGQQSDIHFVLADRDISPDISVSLSATNITVASALNEILFKTGLDVSVDARGHYATLTARRGGGRLAAFRQRTVVITGHVTDAALKAPLAQVAVHVDGTPFGAVSAADGKYTIARVASGTYRVTARRVGYQALSREVAITTDTVATVDFALTAAPTRLTEMVTTAVGDQRRYEVGNVISTINADSITPTAPITSLTDLMSARAPGVTVLENSGFTGTGESIRVRGLTSLVLQSDPILIVDGVRQDNRASGDISGYGWAGTHSTPSRLNDLDFADIATIDILKGPAASTEYGTDAANGVIVITTKHGRAGRTEWRASAEQTASGIPEHFADGYYSWGHTTDGTNTPVNCPLVGYPGRYAVTNNNCAVDSVTRWNPLNHSATSIFGTGARSKYDLSVGGGTDAMRYYVAGGLTNERGVATLPPAFRQLATAAGVQIPSVESASNAEDQRSLRANTSMRLGPTSDLAASGSYLSTYQRTPAMDDLLRGIVNHPAIGDPAHFYGYGGSGGFAGFSPLGTLGQVGSQRTDRFAGGLTANWRPTGWLTAHAVGGIDHGSQGNAALASPNLPTVFQDLVPSLQQITGTSDLYSVDLRATATGRLSSTARSKSSVGLQIVDNRSVAQTALVYGLTSANQTLNGYANPIVTQLSNRTATLGGYGEEEVGLSDRLFITGALRVDAGSGFGSQYHAATYPKVSLSYLALPGGATTVRVRGAFGESGVQPVNGASFQLYQAVTAWSAGQAVSATQLSWPGNTSLKPERTRELEGGADLGFWGNRVSLEVTGYAKHTQDALVNVDLGATLADYLFEQNIGTVQNSGVEGTLTAVLIQGRGLTWDVTLNGSLNHNKLVRLAGTGQVGNIPYAGLVQYRQQVGFSLYGLWARRVSYADANHDGLIETNEITFTDSASYMGPSQPTQTASVSTHVGLWHGTVTVNGLVDYRGGYRILNAALGSEDGASNRREGNVRSVPLAEQARYAAGQLAYVFGGTASSFVEDGTFARFRELGVTVALPPRLARAARVTSLSLTGAVRNLALWTRYSGPDPEVTNTGGGNTQSLSPTTGGGFRETNNDIRFDTGSVPLARYWVLRLTAGF